MILDSFGLPSSLVTSGQMQYFANVALKMNMKLGGVNHSLDEGSLAILKRTPTMLVGMDVTHPGPGTVKGTPSIAAVVASSDLRFARYPCSMRIQESKKEVRNCHPMRDSTMIDAYAHYR